MIDCLMNFLSRSYLSAKCLIQISSFITKDNISSFDQYSKYTADFSEFVACHKWHSILEEVLHHICTRHTDNNVSALIKPRLNPDLPHEVSSCCISLCSSLHNWVNKCFHNLIHSLWLLDLYSIYYIISPIFD